MHEPILYLFDNGNNDKDRNLQTLPQSQRQYAYKDMTLCVSWLPSQIDLPIYHQVGMDAIRVHCCIEKGPFDYPKISISQIDILFLKLSWYFPQVFLEPIDESQ